MKQGKQISLTLCDVSNDFRLLAIPGSEIVFVQRLLVRGLAFGRWGSRYFSDFWAVHHIPITYFVICMIYELSSKRV